MKKNFTLSGLFLLLLLQVSAQEAGKTKTKEFGIKAGYNIAKMSGQKADFSTASKNGFMVAGFFAPVVKKGFGFRSEVVFSRQGFSFGEDGMRTDFTSDYLYLPQFTTVNISRFFQLQLGGQIGFLLQSGQKTGNTEKKDLNSYMNRIDYGAAGGFELFPFKGLILGARYNMSFGTSYKTPSTEPGQVNPLPFNPSDFKGKNAVMNFYIGYKF